MKFGENLRRLRESQGLSIRTLAGKAEVGYVSIFRIEAGQQDPTLSMLRRIAKALDVTVSELIGEK
jgi:transcriptional regulator with XRE-family HTH domain